MTAGRGLPPDADVGEPSRAVDVAVWIAVLTMAPPIVVFLVAAFGWHGLVLVGAVLALAVALAGHHG